MPTTDDLFVQFMAGKLAKESPDVTLLTGPRRTTAFPGLESKPPQEQPKLRLPQSLPSIPGQAQPSEQAPAQDPLSAALPAGSDAGRL